MLNDMCTHTHSNTTITHKHSHSIVWADVKAGQNTPYSQFSSENHHTHTRTRTHPLENEAGGEGEM